MKIKIYCVNCKKEMLKEERYINNKKRWGQKNFFCSARCSNIYQSLTNPIQIISRKRAKNI